MLEGEVIVVFLTDSLELISSLFLDCTLALLACDQGEA